jgi:ABC-type uncharacterized transport system involved in gliding motility auxiliary subunit
MPDERQPGEESGQEEAGADRRGEAAAMLASAGVGLLLAGVGALAMRQRLWWATWVLWGAGGAALIAAAALRPRRVVAFLRGRGVRHGSNTALLVMLVVAIAVLIVYVASRHHRRFDLTRTQANTLSPQTRKILRGLKQPVRITAFYRQGLGGFQEMQDLLSEYRYASPRVKTRMIDPDANPSLARQYGVTSYSTTIVEAGGQKQELSVATEQELTTAVLKLTRARKKKIYFIQGSGEHDPDSFEPDGYSTAREALIALNYEVQKLPLPTQVPGDCDVLVIAGPRSEFDARETDAVSRYLDDGGKALIMVDPEAQQGVSLAGLLEPRGVTPLPDVVVEPSMNFFGDAASVTVMDFAYHDITRPFIRGRALLAVFVLVRAFELEQHPRLNGQDLVRTSADSWLETNFRGTIGRGAGERRGPFTIAAVVTGAPSAAAAPGPTRPNTRLVVFGDSDFAANAVIANGVNKDLFVNSVGWLAESEELISIQPKGTQASPLLLTQMQQRLVFLIAVVAMPLVPLVVGVVVWWRRR